MSRMLKIMSLSLSFCLLALSNIGFSTESGYQNIGRLQQQLQYDGRMNIFMLGSPNPCGSTLNLYTIMPADIDSATVGARTKNIVAMLLAAKMANKKINFSYNCSGTTALPYAIDIE